MISVIILFLLLSEYNQYLVTYSLGATDLLQVRHNLTGVFKIPCFFQNLLFILLAFYCGKNTFLYSFYEKVEEGFDIVNPVDEADSVKTKNL